MLAACRFDCWHEKLPSLWLPTFEGQLGSTHTSASGQRLGIVVLWVACALSSHAQAQLSSFHLRTAGAGAVMLSKDQRTWLEYDRPGLLGDLQLGYAALPWLDVQAGATGGVFLSDKPGGLAAPVFGVLARLPSSAVTPYALVDLGVGFTGAILRPFARAGLGVEFGWGRHLRVGPNLGLGVVTQWDKPGYSSDAVFTWFGLSCSYWPAQLPTASDPLLELRREKRVPVAAPPADEFSEPPPPSPPDPPSPQLVALLDRAVPAQQSELLAPVLFALDSAELEPLGIAMLHEVARVLNGPRADIKLLEIAAYADERGQSEHNLDLSRHRAERVRDWLIEHGVACERLQIRAEGAVDFIEVGHDEADHMQNRRVVFRVLRGKQP